MKTGALLSGLALTSLSVVTASPASIAERAIEVILSAPAVANGVWPGFSVPARNWLIYDDAAVYLVTHESPPSSFVPRGRFFVRQGSLPNLTHGIDQDFHLGPIRLLAIRAAESVEETVGVIYHEAFHSFQAEHFRNHTSDSGRLGEVGPISREQAASIEIERQVLRAAILSRGPNVQHTRQAVALRKMRSAESTTAFRVAEQTAERFEGLADYVEVTSTSLALGRSGRAPLTVIASGLAVPLRDSGGSADERLIRIRAYGTGAAMAVLLDGLRPDWKNLASVRPLDELLAESVSVPANDVSTLVATARERYGYSKLMAAKNPPWGDLNVMSSEAFDALAPYKVVFHVSSGVKAAWQFSPQRKAVAGMHRPSPNVLLLPTLAEFTAEAEGFSLVAVDQPVKLETRDDGTVVTVLLKERPTLGGRPISINADKIDSGGQVRAAGLTVTISGSFRISTSGNVVSVYK